MSNKMRALIVAEEGQGMTEYGLVLGAIAIGVLVTLTALKGKIVELFTNVKNGIPTTGF